VYWVVDSDVVCELCDDALPAAGRGEPADVSGLCWLLEAFTDVLFDRPTLSYQRLQTEQPLSDEELYDKLRKTVPNKHELQVLESFLIFNKYVLSFRSAFVPNRRSILGTSSRPTFTSLPRSRSRSVLRPTFCPRSSIRKSRLECSL
jgi:hypothetical protein